MEDELKIGIPNGSMTFHVERFLQEGGRGQIRKMFKLIREARQMEAWIEFIEDWLSEQIRENRVQEIDCMGCHEVERAKAEVLEQRYRVLKTREPDKEKNEAVKKEAAEYRMRSRKYLITSHEAGRRCKRYLGIQKDAENIFGLEN